MGIGLWLVYGVLRIGIVIIAANSVSLFLLSCILYFELRPRNMQTGAGD